MIFDCYLCVGHFIFYAKVSSSESDSSGIIFNKQHNKRKKLIINRSTYKRDVIKKAHINHVGNEKRLWHEKQESTAVVQEMFCKLFRTGQNGFFVVLTPIC